MDRLDTGSRIYRSPYNVVVDGDHVDCLVISSQSYHDLEAALELSKILQQEANEEEERLHKL